MLKVFSFSLALLLALATVYIIATGSLRDGMLYAVGAVLFMCAAVILDREPNDRERA